MWKLSYIKALDMTVLSITCECLSSAYIHAVHLWHFPLMMVCNFFNMFQATFFSVSCFIFIQLSGDVKCSYAWCHHQSIQCLRLGKHSGLSCKQNWLLFWVCIQQDRKYLAELQLPLTPLISQVEKMGVAQEALLL